MNTKSVNNNQQMEKHTLDALRVQRSGYKLVSVYEWISRDTSIIKGFNCHATSTF